MNKEQLEQFDEKFIYDYFDNTGLEIFGNRKENRPANDEEIKQFISTLLKAERGYHICPECGATAKKVNWKEYRQIKKKYNLYE